VEFNVDSKTEYSALSSTRTESEKKETKTNKRQCPFNSVQVKIREDSLEGIRVTFANLNFRYCCKLYLLSDVFEHASSEVTFRFCFLQHIIPEI